ncbi:MAG: radical SAM protein [Candidatus Lokiarchaeota archaeon]|nr:radical SAM protein [Candidatus Lokiarchaeota archaeon]
MYYKEPIFRPPSEARSLLIQATEGCTYRCSFCVSNLGKPFKIRKVEEIKKDLDIAKILYSSVHRIFFLDGNAMVMPFDALLEITQYAYKLFPELKRVSVYAHGKDILAKSDPQLLELQQAGLKMAYIGIESGDNDLLQKIGKRETQEDIVRAFHKCFKAGIIPSGTIILGLAGSKLDASRKHATKTAELVNKCNPVEYGYPKWYIATLTLMIPPGTPLFFETQDGDFHPMNSDEILRELKLLIEKTSSELQNCVFRSNHASNYIALKGVLAEDKEHILKIIETNIKNPRDLRPEFYRGL